MSMWVVGVDGGTTKTIALAADGEGHIVGAARGPGSNWTGDDVEAPMMIVLDTVRKALRAAGRLGDAVTLAMFCLAGADWPEDHTRRHAVLARSGIARQVCVKNDTFASLRAGTRLPYGIAIAAGTGSNTAVVASDGREWAYGYYVTEGNGASEIAEQALRALLRADDGRDPPTILTAMVLDKLGYPTVEALLRARVAGRVERSRLLALCPLVFAAAEQGDAAAADILVRHGRALAEYAVALARRFDMLRLEFDVVLAGSLFKGQGPLLINTVTQAIHVVIPRARIVRARFEPAVGAVLLAYDALGLSPSDEVYANLARTVPPPSFFDTAEGDGYRPVAPP